MGEYRTPLGVVYEENARLVASCADQESAHVPGNPEKRTDGTDCGRFGSGPVCKPLPLTMSYLHCSSHLTSLSLSGRTKGFSGTRVVFKYYLSVGFNSTAKSRRHIE